MPMKGDEPDYEVLFEQSPCLFLVLNTDLTIIAVTNAYLSYTDTRREDILGRNIFDVFSSITNKTDKTDVQYLRDSMNTVLKNKKEDIIAVQKFDIKKENSDVFEEKYMKCFNIPIYGKNKEIKYIIHKLEDFTEIYRINKEFGVFAVTTAHDVRAPFRNIGGYLELIKLRLKNLPANDEVYEYFERIDHSTKRIIFLLDDLLKFAQVTQPIENFSEVDTGKIVDEVLKNLKFRPDETKPEINVVKDLPKVKGDASQIYQLFQNLISNALKFTNIKTPQIEISFQVKGAFAEFAVKDNGIGIEEKYFSKIFDVFQRLHGLDEYPGTGLGLSICKHIVANHGGKIWLKSELGKGSIFYFTLQLI